MAGGICAPWWDFDNVNGGISAGGVPNERNEAARRMGA